MSILNKSFTAIFLFALLQGCQDENQPNIQNSETEENIKVSKNLISTKKYILRGVENEHVTIQKEGNNFQLLNNDTPLVILDFFTTWCPACRAVTPHLSNLQAKYPKEIKVIGILIEENRKDSEIADFKEEFGADYMISNATGVEDNYANFKLSNEIANLLRQPRSFPIPLVVMFKNGKYFTHYVGAVPEEMIESDIKEALNLRGNK